MYEHIIEHTFFFYSIFLLKIVIHACYYFAAILVGEKLPSLGKIGRPSCRKFSILPYSIEHPLGTYKNPSGLTQKKNKMYTF